jgi:glycosyltransferase involved in cell wall biosynthesis
MKNILIITYYWPPSGGSGVQRWLKFVKYLPQFGYKPFVYTVENGEYPVLDNSLEKDIPKEAVVIKKPIWEPYGFYKKFTGQKKNEKLGHGFVGVKNKSGFKRVMHHTALWVRGNFFIPDARVFWVKPSVAFLKDYIKKNNIDVVVTSGTPHSLHLIALALKKQCGIKWLADFRDPWTGVYYLKDMKLSNSSMRKHLVLEKEVLLQSDVITTVGPNLGENLAKLVSEKDISNKIKIIPNGYDFELDDSTKIELDKKFTIVYIGLFSKEQNHPMFWKALKECIDEDAKLKESLELKFIGNIDSSIEQAISDNWLLTHYNKIGFVSHKEAVAFQRSAQVLLLSINDYPGAKEMLTGKLFEYISSGRPILCLGPKDGDAAAIINDTNTGIINEWNDLAAIKSCIKNYFALFQEGKLNVEAKNLGKYHRKSLTGGLVKILESI